MSTVVAPGKPREAELEELRLALQEMLGAHRRLRSRDSRIVGAIGFAHYRLLSVLRREGATTASNLAQAADLAPATVTEMVDALVGAGLVERVRDTEDRRIVRVSLTPRGRRAYDAKRARFVKAWGTELSDLDPDALRGATVVLERLAQFFDGL
jgi:DNA-binding MarR family transcriptional regulator